MLERIINSIIEHPFGWVFVGLNILNIMYIVIVVYREYPDAKNCNPGPLDWP